MEDLALITPTSDRPVAFQLCERWMARALADYGGPVRWYVVDDGVEPVRCSLDQTVIRRAPCASRAESFLGNLWAGLDAVRESRILFIEDDDWYAVDYVSAMAEALEHADIVGEGRAKYYSLPSRRFFVFENTDYASLCQTGIRRSLLSWFVGHVSQSKEVYVDQPLWMRGGANFRRRLANESRRCIGIKGLPGKTGLSEGHAGEPNWDGIDECGNILRSWLGQEDADIYFQEIAAKFLPR